MQGCLRLRITWSKFTAAASKDVPDAPKEISLLGKGDSGQTQQHKDLHSGTEHRHDQENKNKNKDKKHKKTWLL